MGHLIDSAYNNHQRFLRAEKQDNLIFDGYDQEHWVERNQYQTRDGTEILTTWIMANRHVGFLIKGLPLGILDKKTSEHNFDQICMNKLPQGEKGSLAYLVWDYLYHMEHHIKQIVPSYDREVTNFKPY